MYNLSRLGLPIIFSVILLTGTNVKCTYARTETKPSIAASDLIVVYFPHNPSFRRLFGISADTLIQALDEFKKNNNARPLGSDAFATTIKSSSQKELLLMLLDTKGIPVKSSDGDSEILLTERAWKKFIIIDQHGVITSIVDRNGNISDDPSDYKVRCKLTPSVLRRFHDLMSQVFPQSTLPNKAIEKS